MNGFYKTYKEKKAEQNHQEDLKKQYNIEQDNVVVVEKKHILKFVINTVASILKFLAAGSLFVLAGIGLLCIFYNDKNIIQIINELRSLLGLG